jgi:ferredoxin, 2Fe-2S
VAVKVTFLRKPEASAAGVAGGARGDPPAEPPPPITVECPAGATLFEAGGKALAAIDTACVGKGTCGLCRVKVISGAELLSPYSDEELRHLGNLYHLTRVRLSCRARLGEAPGGGGEVVVEVVRKKRGK